MSKSERLQGLYVLTNEDLTPSARLMASVEQAIAGGSRIVQYRDKTSSPSTRVQQARQLQVLSKDTQTLFIVNDDIALAGACHADGVHLGKDDAGISYAREQLGADCIIGVSCYNDISLALAAEQAGADYVAFGSFYSSDIKPEAVRADIDMLAMARKQLGIPIAAIGGITQANAAELIAAGADMLAVISAVFAQTDIEPSARNLSQLFPGN
jgi:thiamine-phosphate pyrophosphorylase